MAAPLERVPPAKIDTTAGADRARLAGRDDVLPDRFVLDDDRVPGLTLALLKAGLVALLPCAAVVVVWLWNEWAAMGLAAALWLLWRATTSGRRRLASSSRELAAINWLPRRGRR